MNTECVHSLNLARYESIPCRLKQHHVGRESFHWMLHTAGLALVDACFEACFVQVLGLFELCWGFASTYLKPCLLFLGLSKFGYGWSIYFFSPALFSPLLCLRLVVGGYFYTGQSPNLILSSARVTSSRHTKN